MIILTVFAGLPGAGKSTAALVHHHQTGHVLVTRDGLRVMLAVDDATLTRVHVAVVRTLLTDGRSVVVDACNLHADDYRAWRTLATSTGAHFTWCFLNVPVEVCVARDARRADPVGADRIRQMHANSTDLQNP